jgi:hypothetical protein
MEDTLLPPGIARSMSQRSKMSHSSNGSEDWRDDSGFGGEKMGFENKYANTFARRDLSVGRGAGAGDFGGRYRDGENDVGDVSPLSPLPPAKTRGGHGDDGQSDGNVHVDGMVFNLVPKSPRNPVKKQERVELAGEVVEKEKVFELSV